MESQRPQRRKTRSSKDPEPKRPSSGPLNIGALNVRTLMSTGQRGLLAATIKERNVDICCLSELRIPGSGIEQLKIPGFDDSITMYFSGPTDNEPQGTQGVGIALSKKAEKAVIQWEPINGRIARIRLKARPINWSIIAVYAPTNSADDDVAEGFYRDLERAVDNCPPKDFLVVAGDLNAQIGGLKGNHQLRKVIGPYAVGDKICRNGELLVSFASNYGFPSQTQIIQIKCAI